MCFRLLAAVRAPNPGGEERPADGPRSLEELAFQKGLDVRIAPAGPTRFVEITWGDCACSLYTKRDGRRRVVDFVNALLVEGQEVHLLLFTDGEQLDWQSREPEPVALSDFRAQGLGALPEGRVARLVWPGLVPAPGGARTG